MSTIIDPNRIDTHRDTHRDQRKRGALAVCGVPYSSNLGDGVISDCLNFILRRNSTSLDIVNIDLAGRQDYGETTVANRKLLIRCLSVLPHPARNLIVRIGLGRKVASSLAPQWHATLKKCCGTIIGGGQLLSDADLNFPLKIGLYLKQAETQRLPVAYYACGVTLRNSDMATRMLIECLRGETVKGIWVRDKASQSSLKNRANVDSHFAYDPAIHVEDTYDVRRTHQFDVGLNLSDPINLRYSCGRALPEFDQLGPIFGDAAKQLASNGHRIALFTNGAEEDEDFLARTVEAHGLDGHPGITILPRPKRPGDLVTAIASMNCVVAHRLHANIIAFGLKIPSVGLEWSEKVPNFFRMSGRPEHIITPSELSTGLLLDRISRCSANTLDTSILDQMKHASLESANKALRAITGEGNNE